jgi:aspartyl-tRNA(Asn)/glutamyl-tRNA(Gln) amidotransferase subunit C
VKPTAGFTFNKVIYPSPIATRGPDMDLSECYHFPVTTMPESKITLEQVRHVALLARLELSPQDENRLRTDMDEMLAYVDKLNELDTKNVAPTTQVGEAGTPMRDDEVTNRPDADAILANAPSRDRNYFKVPKIIE